MKVVVIAFSVFAAGIAGYSSANARTTNAEPDADRYSSAEKYFKRGDYTAATIELKNILQRDPANLPARIFMGRIYLRIGAVELAIKELRRAQELGGDEELIILPLVSAKLMGQDFRGVLTHKPKPDWSARARTALFGLRGQAFIGLRKYSDAEAALTKAMDLEPKSTSALAAFAQLYMKLGQMDSAVSAIETALGYKPDSFHLWHVKGEVDRFSGKPGDAVKSFGKAISLRENYAPSRIGRASALVETGQFKDALKDIEYLRQNKPPHALIAFLHSKILAHLGKTARSREALNDAYALIRGYDRKDISDNTSLLLLAGMVSHAKNNLTDAFNYLSEFVLKDPSHAGAHALLGSILLNRGDTKKALELLRTARVIAPDNPQILRLLGMTFMRVGDHKSAELAFQKAISESSRTSSVHTMLALSQVRSGQNDAAIRGLEEVLLKDSKAANAGIMLGLVYLQEKKFDEALRVARFMSEKLPKNPVLYNLMGVAYWGQSDITAARESLEKALEIEPNYVSAQSNLAKIEVSAGQPGSARKRYRKIQQLPGVGVQPLIELAHIAASEKQYESAFKFLESARARDSGNRQVKLALIEMYLRADRADLAVQLARQLRNQGPDNLATLERLGRAELAAGLNADAKATFLRLAELSPPKGKMLESAAHYLIRVGDDDGAQKTLLRATLFDPDHLGSHVSLIRLETKMRRYDKALQRANSLIARLPEEPVAYNLKGDILLKTGRAEEAVGVYEAGLRLEESGPLLIRLQLAHNTLGKTKASLGRLERWAASNPMDLAVRKVLAGAYLDLKNTKAAIAEYEDLRKRKIVDPDIINNLAWLYHQTGDSRALEMAEEAYRLAPTNSRILDTLGWILVRDGADPARGLKLLRDAYARAANRPAIRYHLAVALSQQGQNDDARRYLDEIIKAGGAGDILQQARDLRLKLGK